MTCASFPPYYDEGGKYHNHDPNTFSQSWECSNGHHGTVKSKSGWYCCNVPGSIEIQTAPDIRPPMNFFLG